MNPDLSLEENPRQHRMFVCLNTIDSNVERQAQWVTHSLLKRPLEYTTHKFCCFNVYNFMSGINRFLDPVSAPSTETTIPIVEEEASPNSVVQATNRRIDYEYRCPTLITMRFHINDSPPNYLFHDTGTPEETLSKMNPYEYHFRVTKHPMENKPLPIPYQVTLANLLTDLTPHGSVLFEDDHGETPSYKLKATECFFHPDHPQRQSYVQRIRDVSNPKVAHVIATMFAFMLPNEKDDPDKYFLVLCAILTPYQNVKDLFVDFRDDAAPPFPNLQESFRAYMSTLSLSDPIKHQWIKRVLVNMTAIREGNISRLSNE